MGLILVLPAVLVTGWLVMWLVNRPLKWIFFFVAGLALILLTVVVFLLPRHPCTDSGLACVSDTAFIASLNVFAGFATWLVLLVMTALFKAVVTIAERVDASAGRPAGEDPNRRSLAESHATERPDSGRSAQA
jgi:O-antigen ligase